MKKILTVVVLITLLTSCLSNKKTMSRIFKNELKRTFYQNQFTGILIVDPATKDTLYSHNSEKYFTPASNTKIFTLFAGLEILPKYIPALQYLHKNDTIFFSGTGDPAFLHPYLKDSTVFQFLKSNKHLVAVTNTFLDERFGPGWSWDDYQYYYAAERNAFPIHGNVVLIEKSEDLNVSPKYFKDSVLLANNKKNRKEFTNQFYYPSYSNDTLETPYIANEQTSMAILSNILQTKIETAPQFPEGNKEILSGIALDSLYIRMMHESDNFIAEQLLLSSSFQLKDSLKSSLTRNYILENQLKNLEQKPRWVDGSGLSRYNLFTPENMVVVLNKLYQKLSRERLFKIFPAGGLSGTLKGRFVGEGKPYIYAKSGSLSNNYCLSGYLLTNSGKTLIFSFMNNHFQSSTQDQRDQLERFLQILRDSY